VNRYRQGLSIFIGDGSETALRAFYAVSILVIAYGWVEEWTAKVENWWRDFWAEQQRNLERNIEQWINDLARQLCGGPASILLGVAAIVWRRRQ
jgi:hypothetical protein